MSHFFTVVLVPKDTVDIEAKVEEILSPFDENIEVEEYDKKCWCVNRKAHDAGWKAAENKFGPFGDLRKSFWDKVESQISKDLDRNSKEYWEIRDKIADTLDWKKWTQAFNMHANFIEVNHPLHDKPDSECEECKGTGFYKSTYNPHSKWDWWVIGGRWDGSIQNNYRSDNDGGFNFGDEHHQLQHNTISCKDLLEIVKNDSSQYPYSLVTPNGEWCQRGEMGWWGMSSNEKDTDDWHDTVNKILEKYEDCIAVGCDLHI